MRLSTDHYPEFVDFYCPTCERDREDVRVDSIEDDFVRAECPDCGEPFYVRVIY